MEIHDLLRQLPHRAWEGQTHWAAENCYPAYVEMGRRWQPRRILEVGAFEGYGLIAFWLGAGPGVQRLDWIDAETFAPNTNQHCRENLRAATTVLGWRRPYSVFARGWPQLPDKGPYDLIHVDAGHTFREALTDIVIAWRQRQPPVLLVDDYDFLPEVRRAVQTFSDLYDVPFTYAPSLRGWAVFQRAA